MDVRLPIRWGRALAVSEGMGKYWKLAMRHADAEAAKARRRTRECMVRVWLGGLKKRSSGGSAG